MCGFPGNKFFLDPDKCGHQGFQVKCVSMYWEMPLRNGGLGGVGNDMVHRREESRVFHQDLLSPLAMSPESMERPQKKVCYRPVEYNVGLDLEGW